MATAREPVSAWSTPRGDAGDSLRRAGQGLMASAATPRGAAAGGGLCPGGFVAPSVPAAGKAGDLAIAGGIQARRGLQPDIIVATPRTPDHMNEVQRRHRQKGGPGELCLHFGLMSVKVPPANGGYGIKPDKGEDVAQIFQAGHKLGVAEYQATKKEAVYATNIREPLGRPWVRGHRLPDRVMKQDFKGFGNPSTLAAFDSKELMFPRDLVPDSSETKEMYKKTHGSYDAGESVNRRYQWPEAILANPHHVFGVCENVERGGGGSGAKSALKMDCGDEPLSVARTTVISALAVGYQQIATDQLATSRCSTQCVPPVPLGHFFGVGSAIDECDAGALVRGSYTAQEQMPDDDLGRCTVPGRRNFVTKGALGVPTVRTDIKAVPSERRSLANATNFGDEPDAPGVIFPGKFQTQGVNDNDFKAVRSKAELRSILEGAGYALPFEDYEGIFAMASSDTKTASLEAVMDSALEWSAYTGSALTPRGDLTARPGSLTRR